MKAGVWEKQNAGLGAGVRGKHSAGVGAADRKSKTPA